MLGKSLLDKQSVQSVQSVQGVQGVQGVQSVQGCAGLFSEGAFYRSSLKTLVALVLPF